MNRYSHLVILCIWCLGITLSPVTAQIPVCGIVDDLQYPVDTVESQTFARGFDDFGLFRARFNGLHVGFDLAFRQYGASVYAIARGRVTYSDVEGWDTEGGVVVIEHTFPNGEIYYSVYGHMMESDQVVFPAVDRCVEQGEVIGLITDPSLSAPHLHYEIRDFLPDRGGPGYTNSNPLAQGWSHPLEFTHRWQLRLSPMWIADLTLQVAPTLPPQGRDPIAIATGSAVEVIRSDNTPLWRIDTSAAVIGLAMLADGRVIVQSLNNQISVVNAGRYEAAWRIADTVHPLILIGETVIVMSLDGTITAYRLDGTLLWSTPNVGRGVALSHSHEAILRVVETGGNYLWQVFSITGEVLHEAQFLTRPWIAPVPNDPGWWVIEGNSLSYAAPGIQIAIADLPFRLGEQPSLTLDAAGNSYLYLDDPAQTLLALDGAGQVRWQIRYPLGIVAAEPLLATDGCVLYALDGDGHLRAFAAGDGRLLNEALIYAGGDRNRMLSARVLRVEGDQLTVSTGFLSVFTLSASAFAQNPADCLIGRIN
jgi:murein DD-endopeptidase MepM/ murein hydrolase activator NlpD